jgi:hypothetical protein
LNRWVESHQSYLICFINKDMDARAYWQYFLTISALRTNLM